MDPIESGKCPPVCLFYRAAVCFAVVFNVLHLVSLPIEISYDGLGYIDMADVLFSGRFPQDWLPNRAPLFPLTLKIAFWAIGRQAQTAALVSSALGLAGILALGDAVRRIAGRAAASSVIVFVCLYPTLVVYQHSVLTEAGTFFFLALLVNIAVRPAASRRAMWGRALALIAVSSLGFYWRQNILAALPALAALLIAAEWKYDALRAVIARNLAIVVLPVACSLPWNAYSNALALRDVSIRQGIIRQALLPSDHPYIGEHRADYETAIRASAVRGNFYSGISWPLLTELSPKIFSGNRAENTMGLFTRLVLQNPLRYGQALARSTLFFAGVPGIESDNRAFREEVLSLTAHGAKISDGPQPLQRRIREQFSQTTSPSVLMRGLRVLGPVYDALLLPATSLTLGALVIALIRRRRDAALLYATPLLYLASYAVFLSTIDRFMTPVYPFFLAVLALACHTAASAFSQRFRQARPGPSYGAK